MRKVLEHENLRKLKALLSARYGKNIKMNFMMDVSEAEQGTQAPKLIAGDLRIPLISRNGDHLASINVLDAGSLAQEDQSSITQLVYLLLEPVFYSWTLEVKSEVKESIFYNLEQQENIIPFKNLNQHPEFVRSVSTNIMFLESRNPLFIRKVVDEIHEMSLRTSCLPFDAIQGQIKSAKDIAILGSSTIVVHDLLHLSHNDRLVIAEYLNMNFKTGPLILIASSSSLRDLKSQQMVESFILPHLEKCILEVERLPLKNPLLREALELLLEPGATI